MKPHGPLALALSLSLAASTFAADTPAPKPEAAPAATPEAAASQPKKPFVLPDPVATVEGVDIKKAELEQAFNAFLASQGVTADQLPEEQKEEGYRMVLDDLVTEKLVTARAAKQEVSDEEVAAQLEKIKANFGSEEALKKEAEKAGQTLEKLKANIRSRLQQERWLDAQVKGKDTVTDADAEDFYKKNPGQFQMPERVRASHILIAVPADAKPEVVAEKEKASKAIAERVKKGEPFDQLAKELSEDPSAKQNSGDLNYFTKDQMVPEFANAAFSMKKDEISDPVRTQFGFHVIKVVDHASGETVTLEKAKPQLLAYLQQQKKRAEVQKVLEDIRAKADVKVNLPPPSAPVADVPAMTEPASTPAAK